MPGRQDYYNPEAPAVQEAPAAALTAPFTTITTAIIHAACVMEPDGAVPVQEEGLSSVTIPCFMNTITATASPAKEAEDAVGATAEENSDRKKTASKKNRGNSGKGIAKKKVLC